MLTSTKRQTEPQLCCGERNSQRTSASRIIMAPMLHWSCTRTSLKGPSVDPWYLWKVKRGRSALDGRACDVDVIIHAVGKLYPYRSAARTFIIWLRNTTNKPFAITTAALIIRDLPRQQQQQQHIISITRSFAVKLGLPIATESPSSSVMLSSGAARSSLWGAGRTARLPCQRGLALLLPVGRLVRRPAPPPLCIASLRYHYYSSSPVRQVEKPSYFQRLSKQTQEAVQESLAAVPKSLEQSSSRLAARSRQALDETAQQASTAASQASQQLAQRTQKLAKTVQRQAPRLAEAAARRGTSLLQRSQSRVAAWTGAQVGRLRQRVTDGLRATWQGLRPRIRTAFRGVVDQSWGRVTRSVGQGWKRIGSYGQQARTWIVVWSLAAVAIYGLATSLPGAVVRYLSSSEGGSKQPSPPAQHATMQTRAPSP
jgi:hypothetical protein